MGTNYYTLSGEHVGKVTFQKFMNGWPEAVFTWAMPPSQIEQLCAEHLTVACVEDEYGKQWTGQEFMDSFSPVSWDIDLIGQEFS